MSPEELNRLAHRLISEKIANAEIVELHWAVTELINSQGEIHGEGAPFYLLCARKHTYEVVKNAVGKYDRPSEETPTLEGFDCVQEAYPMKRGGERKLVPADLCSDQELLARAREFHKQAKGLIKHAKELERYVKKRRNDLGDSAAS